MFGGTASSDSLTVLLYYYTCRTEVNESAHGSVSLRASPLPMPLGELSAVQPFRRLPRPLRPASCMDLMVLVLQVQRPMPVDESERPIGMLVIAATRLASGIDGVQRG